MLQNSQFANANTGVIFKNSSVGTGVRGLMRGLATLLQGIQEPLVVRERDGKPQEDPLAVHCFCVCNSNALLGNLLGV